MFSKSCSYLRVYITVHIAGHCFPLSTLVMFIDLLHINLLVIFLPQFIVVNGNAKHSVGFFVEF